MEEVTTMFWTKEYDFHDKEIRHMYKEYAIAVGAFTGLVAIAIIVAVLL